MTKFFKYGDRNRKQQGFDREKITITKAGMTVNVYDQIQANNVDTDIYEVAKKYHMMPDEAVELMKERGGEKGVFMDIREMQEKVQNIGDAINVAKEAENMFKQLPLEIRQKYGHDLNLWYKDQEKIRKAELQKKETETKETQPKQEVTNETK